MGVLSLGLYIAYCNYRNWLHIRGQRGLKLIPLLCTLFGGFTLYWLMKSILARSSEANLSVEGTALGVTLMWWLPSLVALAWHLSVAEHVVASLPLAVIIFVEISLVMANVTFSMVALLQIQQAANTCEGDPLGLQNAQFTWMNAIWIVIGWLPVSAIFSYAASHHMPM